MNDNMPLIINQDYSVAGVIDHFEEKSAVIEIENCQKIIWPKDKIDKDLKEGSGVKLVLVDDKIDQSKKDKIAKELINQILKSG